MKRWEELALSGDYVEIRGPCVSGCTLIMMHIPSSRLCFGENASLGFHLAQIKYDGHFGDHEFHPDLKLSQWMVDHYPQDIHNWLMNRGCVEKMTVRDMWSLPAEELWTMGYRKCEPEKLVPMTILRSKRAT